MALTKRWRMGKDSPPKVIRALAWYRNGSVKIRCPHCKKLHWFKVEDRDGGEGTEVLAPRVCEASKKWVVICLKKG